MERLMKEFLAASKESGNVDENGKVHLFPEICKTSSLILKQYPMTVEQILSVKDYDRFVLDSAIDFLRGDNDGAISSTLYL